MKARPYDDEFRAALAAGRERRYAEAVALLSGLLRKSDEYPEAVLYLGRSYHALGEHSRAVNVLTFFVRLAPRSAAGQFFLGRSYLALGQPVAALRHLKRACAIRPGFVAGLALAGVAALRSRRPTDAVALLQRAVEGDPDNRRIFTAYLNALLTQAIKLFREGNLTLSGQILQFVLKNHEDSVTAHVYLGRIFRDLGKPLPALNHFTIASALVPEDAALHLQRAALLLQTGQAQEAIEALGKAATGVDAKAFLTRDPTQLARLLCVSYFQNRRYRDAISQGMLVLKVNPEEAQTHVILAESFRNLGELDKARGHYERALEKDRKDPDLLYGLAMVLLEQEKLAELLSVLTRIDHAHPGDPTAAYYLAICRSRMGEEPATTIRLLQEQVRSRGPDPFLMIALAKDYLRAGLPELAAGWFGRTLRIRADDREALHGLVLTSTALGQPEEQLRSYRNYLELYPQEDSLRKDFIRLLLEKGAYAEAEGQIERLIPHEPNNKTLRELLATCYRRTGRYADAIVLRKELLLADPRSEEHLKELVYCLDRGGERELAVRLLEKAIPSFPQNVGLRLILGTLLVKSGRLEQAATLFRQIVSLDPKEPVALEQLGNIHKRLGDDVFAEKFYARARAARAKRGGGTQTPAESRPLHSPRRPR